MQRTLNFDSLRPVIARYSPPAIVFHWLVALLIAIAYAMVITKGYLPKGSAPRALTMRIHEWAGVLVFVVAVPRLLWRLLMGAPTALPGQSWLVRAGAIFIHLLLYLFIFAQPILGYLTLNASGHTLDLWGISLPQFLAASQETRRTLKDFHETLGNAFYWVIGLHALAALWHHYVRRDDTLRRML